MIQALDRGIWVRMGGCLCEHIEVTEYLCIDITYAKYYEHRRKVRNGRLIGGII